MIVLLADSVNASIFKLPRASCLTNVGREWVSLLSWNMLAAMVCGSIYFIRKITMRSFLFLTSIVLTMTSPAAWAEGKPVATKKAVSYRRDIRPIVKRHCLGCHARSNPKGGLSMHSVAAMRKGGESGTLFTPGKPNDSLLLQMTVGKTPDMPQKQPPLSAAKIALLRQWVLTGAKDDSLPGDAGPVVRIPKIYRFAPAVTSVAINPTGTLIAAACRSEVVLVDVAGKKPPVRLATQCDLLTHVEFSPDGKLLAASGGSPSQYGEVRIFNPTNGKLISMRRVSHDTLFRGSFSPDGKTIALGGADGAVHLVPVNMKEKVRRFELHSDWVFDVAYTPDGKQIVSGGRDKATKVSSVETGKLLRNVDSSSAMITSVASDAKFAVSAGNARTLIAYEYKIALAGVQVTGAGNGARPISRRAQYVKNFESQPAEIHDLAVSSDRKFVATAGASGEIRVYQIADRKRIALIRNVPAPVYSITLNKTGSQLAVGTRDGRVQLYSVPDGKLLKSLVPVPVKKP
jgi:hypothetical protein